MTTTKSYNLEGLDCAVCGEKIANSISKIEGISDVRVNFLSQRLTFTVEDIRPEHEFIKAIKKAIKKIEPDTQLSEEI